jgi:hypothetical protein
MLTYKQWLTEAISLSKYREMFKLVNKDYLKRYEEWFGKDKRITLPLSGAESDPTYQEVNNKISSKGYEISSWKDGLATKKDSKYRVMRIGKLLADDKETLQKFNERFKGKKVSEDKEYEVVISRHAYDLFGQSTDRQWTSCKALTQGENSYYIPSEINDGYLVAYVIEKGDTTKEKLADPISRLLIVPYINVNDPDDTFLYVPDRPYGKSVTGFRETVQAWLDKKQGKKSGIYCKTRTGYDDKYPAKINKDTGEESLQENPEFATLKLGSIPLVSDGGYLDYSPDRIKRYVVDPKDVYPLSSFIEEVFIDEYNLKQAAIAGANSLKAHFINTLNYLIGIWEDEEDEEESQRYIKYLNKVKTRIENGTYKISYRLE